MATKYIQKFASTADFIARAADRSLAFGLGAVSNIIYGNIGGTATALVDVSSAQTLTNKTLTSPTLNSLTITSPVINTPTINGPATDSRIVGDFSTSTVSAGYNADTYLAGSSIAIPAGGWLAGSRYMCVFDMVKTSAGTAQFTVNLRMGTGVVGDASIIQWQFAAGTAAADTGMFYVVAHFRTVGSGTSAVVVGSIECSHHLAATGLISTGASGFGVITSVSSGFDSTTANGVIGLSVNGGGSFSGTNTIVEAEYHSF